MKETTFTVTYLGGPTIILEINGLRLITDPTLDVKGSIYQLGNFQLEKTENPFVEEIGEIDYVLLSHDQHPDNLDTKGKELLSHVKNSFTTKDGAERLKGRSIGMSPWQNETILTPDNTKIIITATPARHGPTGSENITGSVIGFLISVEGNENHQIYITGDTVFYEGVQEVALRSNPKYVFAFGGAVRANGLFHITMNENDLVETSFSFPHATIIPIHYEGWKHFTQNEKNYLDTFAMLGISNKLEVLKIGVTTAFIW